MKPTLLKDYCGQDVSGWLMSEKLDGWRMMWTGSDFITREENVLDAPEWFKAGMPQVALDGELFAGAGMFNATQRRMAEGWTGLSYKVFDAPEVLAPFRKRLAFLECVPLPTHVEIVPHIRCRGTEHLLEFADEIVANGGEGAVVRNPKAMYQAGRTYDVLRWVPQCPRVNRLRSA